MHERQFGPPDDDLATACDADRASDDSEPGPISLPSHANSPPMRANDGASINPDLAYELDDKPPWWEAGVVGLQHVLAMFAAIITPAVIVADSISLGPEDAAFFIGMALFASGLSTFVQVRRFGPLGSGLLSVQGTSFTFVRPAMQAGQAGGLPLILGMSLLCAPAEILVSRVIARTRRIFPPIVSGTAVALIGLTLIKVGMTDFAGGFGAPDFGSLENLALATLVLGVIVAANRLGRGMVRVGAVMLGIAAGYAVSGLLGRLDFSNVQTAAWLTFPAPLHFGLSFDAAHLAPWLLAYAVTSVETVGDLTATCAVSNQPVHGKSYTKRLAGGTLADGVGSMVAAVFNSLPNTTFSQNNGVIQVTGVASRRVGFMVAGILMFLGLSPKLGAIVSAMPKPVLGGATLALFGMVAAAGIRIIAMSPMSSREMLILAIALGTGLGVEMVPEALNQLPELIQTTLGTGLVAGTLVALCMNLLLPSAPERNRGKL